MIKRFINWIGRVIIGWWNVITKKETPEFKRRLQICLECEDKVKLGKNVYICSICGCEIHAKSKSPNEKCHKGKW